MTTITIPRALLEQALTALTYQGSMGPTRRQRRAAAIEALRAELAKPSKPAFNDVEMAEELRRHGLTLVSTTSGYKVMKLGAIEAQAELAKPVGPPTPTWHDAPVLAEVAAERQRQDEIWGGPKHDDLHSTAEFVQFIEDYANRARTMAGMNSQDKARSRLVQVAALAVAAVESIDRAAITKAEGKKS